MDKLKYLEGKIIKTVKEDFDVECSYIIIKLETGETINITGYGLGQIDIEISEID